MAKTYRQTPHFVDVDGTDLDAEIARIEKERGVKVTGMARTRTGWRLSVTLVHRPVTPRRSPSRDLVK